MTDLGVVLLGLCGGTSSAYSGLLKVTFSVVDMVSKAKGVEATLGTLNSIIPNLMLHRIVILWGMWCLQNVESHL